MGKVRAGSPSKPATKSSNNNTFKNQAFFTVFISLYFWYKGELIGCTHIFTVYLYLKNVFQRASTLIKLQRQTIVLLCVCVCVWEAKYCCGGGLLEDMGCVLQLRHYENLP